MRSSIDLVASTRITLLEKQLLVITVVIFTTVNDTTYANVFRNTLDTYSHIVFSYKRRYL